MASHTKIHDTTEPSLASKPSLVTSNAQIAELRQF